MKLVEFKSGSFGFTCAKKRYLDLFVHYPYGKAYKFFQYVPIEEMVDMGIALRSLLRGSIRHAIGW